jgi:hypothetical protein
MQPLYDALRDMIPAEKLDHYIERWYNTDCSYGFYAGTNPRQCFCYSG